MSYLTEQPRRPAMRAILHLYDTGMPLMCSELARAAESGNTTMARTLRMLTARGILDRQDCPGMSTGVYTLTDKGEAIAWHLRAIEEIEEALE